MSHFCLEDVVAVLEEIEDAECLLLELTGELIEGTLIAGQDFVLMLVKGKPLKAALKKSK